MITNDVGGLVSQQRYLPFGGVRDDVSNLTQTDYGYTGQRDLGSMGLMDYRARFYSNTLGRFIQPDTLIPDQNEPQYLNRYTYVLNNPVRNTDPTGHRCKDGGDENIWGYCGDKLPTPDNVREKDRGRYLRDVQSEYNIQLAPLDYLIYSDYALGGAGWTPSKDDDEYLDRLGNLKYAEDKSVLITANAFETCTTIDCIAGIIAHEASHSWIEYKVEQTGTAGNERLLNEEMHAAEEMAADVVAIQIAGDDSGYLTANYNHFGVICGKQCEPLSFDVLEEYYGINLADLINLVSGK